MKILKRDAYKLKEDVLICTGLSEMFAKIICKELNDLKETDSYFYQVVSDNFEIKR